MGDRVEIGGHPTWVETRGSGENTVVLLHGGVSNSDVMLDALSAPLEEQHYRVIAFDRRGHGYTADTDAPFHYEDMATETIGVLEDVVGGPAHLVGWSDGGIVGLHVALRRPDLVDRIVAIGTNFHHDGIMPIDIDPNSPLASRLVEAYAERSPDGAEHFGAMFDKFMAMATTEPTLTVDDVAKIAAPTLVLVGDDDLIHLSHTAALYEALPAGQLAVVPAASHVLPLEHPAQTARIIVDFLAGDMPPSTLMPARRAASVQAT